MNIPLSEVYIGKKCNEITTIATAELEATGYKKDTVNYPDFCHEVDKSKMTSNLK